MTWKWCLAKKTKELNHASHTAETVNTRSSKSPRSSPFDSEVELEDLATASLTKELEELPQVHVVPSVPVGIECGLLEAVKPPQPFRAPTCLVRQDVLSMTDHDALPGQNLHPARHCGNKHLIG